MIMYKTMQCIRGQQTCLFSTKLSLDGCYRMNFLHLAAQPVYFRALQIQVKIGKSYKIKSQNSIPIEKTYQSI